MLFTFLAAFQLLVSVHAFLYSLASKNSSDVTNSTNLNDTTGTYPHILRGVNLGGWLVLEPYITPSLFLEFNSTNGTEKDIPVDEYHYWKKLGKEEAEVRLRKHWDNFYTEKDFSDIKGAGLNMVRIPVGYWVFSTLKSDPYKSDIQQEYLDRAIEWAHKYGLKVWIDLHGVPQSQNGFDNSGLRSIGYPGWFNHTENIDLSKKVLHKIFSKYSGNFSAEYPGTIIGIELVNEPLSTKLSLKKLKSFYEDVVDDSKKVNRASHTLVIQDGFQKIGYWDEFMTSENILIDHHHYEVFSSSALNMLTADHLKSIQNWSADVKKELKHHRAIVGEWLAALTDCTPWLNGVGLGARYAGEKPYNNKKIGTCADINDWSKWSLQKKKNYRKFIEMQLDQYERNANGWIFWCYKTETSIEWDFSRLVDLKLMPQPLSDRKFIVNGQDPDAKKGESGDLAMNKWMLFILAVLMLII